MEEMLPVISTETMTFIPAVPMALTTRPAITCVMDCPSPLFHHLVSKINVSSGKNTTGVELQVSNDPCVVEY
jgi:hypothetical protein